MVPFCQQDLKIRWKTFYISWCCQICNARSSSGYQPSILTWSPQGSKEKQVQQWEEDFVIGSNCPSVIKLKQVIPGRSSDPHVIRALLGCLMSQSGSEGLPSHGFVVETLVKEIISSEAIKRMFKQDFNEGNNVAQQILSKADRRFMTKYFFWHRQFCRWGSLLPFLGWWWRRCVIPRQFFWRSTVSAAGLILAALTRWWWRWWFPLPRWWWRRCACLHEVKRRYLSSALPIPIFPV